MKNFDLEKWKTGEYDVVTRSKKKVRILCTDKECDKSFYSIVALVKEEKKEVLETYTASGRYYATGDTSIYDLFLVKKGWSQKLKKLFKNKLVLTKTRNNGQ